MSAASKSRKRNVDGIAQRIKSVIEQQQINEVARRTKTAKACIYRYVRGAKIPASFCARLSQEFQVSPDWLLTGDGSRHLLTVAGSLSQLADTLLDKVQAINNITHARLGALSGKYHEQVARELNEASRSFEDQCNRIGSYAKPVFQHLATQLGEAMDRLDIDLANELMKATDGIERLCFDSEITVQNLQLKTRISLLRMQSTKAVEYQRRLFCMPLGKAALDDNEFCTMVTRLLQTYGYTGDNTNALKVAKVAMLLCEGNEDRLTNYPTLAAVAGSLMVTEGQLFEGLQLLQQWVDKINHEARRASMRHQMSLAMMLAGSLAPEEAFTWGKREHVWATNILLVAMLRLEPKLLKQAVDYYADPKTPKYKIYAGREYIFLYAKAILAALQGRKKLAKATFSKAAENVPVRGLPILNTLFHRAMGDDRQLRAGAKASVEYLTEGLPGSTPLFMVAIHHKNVLAAGIKNPATEAFVSKYREYVLFEF
ncbi:MAG: hypothetical protein L3J82_04865 [Planctomycetes bacterium]|nr:hypothetical protein [Planctomycetota bacterium]